MQAIENSIDDESVPDVIADDQPTTFEVIVGGSHNGKIYCS